MFLCCLVTLSGFQSKFLKLVEELIRMNDGFLADLACFVGNPGIICFFTILVPSQFLCYVLETCRNSNMCHD